MTARVKRAGMTGSRSGEFTTIPMRMTPTPRSRRGSRTLAGRLLQFDERGDGAPVARSMREDVQVGRAPVLDERRATVPAHPPIKLLEVVLTGPAGADLVTLLLVFPLELD